MNTTRDMKNTLNKFAFWLYEITQPEKPLDVGMLWKGKKVMVSKFLPEDTILLGSKDWEDARYAFLNQKVKTNGD